MHDIKILRNNFEEFKKLIKTRNVEFDFVELIDIGTDMRAKQLAAYLPVIYSVSEHKGDLYIIMEKLLPNINYLYNKYLCWRISIKY